MERAVILTGGNLGDVRHTLAEARRLLREKVGKEVTASSVMESEPWGFTAPENFRNQVLVFDTELSPEEFLECCLTIENQLGRERGEVKVQVKEREAADALPGMTMGISAFAASAFKPAASAVAAEPERDAAKAYESRLIDIDILFFGDRVIGTPELTVPHPLIQDREFVLEPLVEVMPGFRHPVLGKTMIQLLRELREGK